MRLPRVHDISRPLAVLLTIGDRDALLVEIRQISDGGSQNFKSWDEQSEPNPEQRRGGENIMEMHISTISYSLRAKRYDDRKQKDRANTGL